MQSSRLSDMPSILRVGNEIGSIAPDLFSLIELVSLDLSGNRLTQVGTSPSLEDSEGGVSVMFWVG